MTHDVAVGVGGGILGDPAHSTAETGDQGV
jgi:hypothetical protein